MNLSKRPWAAALAVLALAAAACSPAGPAASPVPAGSDAAAGALRAWVNLSGDADRSFHLLQTGTFTGAGQSFDVRYELDASGRDLRGVIDVVGQKIELVVIDDLTYVKAGDSWTTAPTDTDLTSDVLDIFRYVGEPTNLQFVERLEEGGEALFHFRAIEPVPYQTSQMKESGVTGSIPVLDFFIRADGVPVRVTFSSTAEQGGVKVEGHSTVEFSRWGEPIAIEAPI